MCETCNEVWYCKECGSRLSLKIKTYQKYDSETGVRINLHYHYWKCPKRNIFSFLWHDFYSDAPEALLDYGD